MRRVLILVGSVFLLARLAQAAPQMLPRSFSGWAGSVQAGLLPAAAVRPERQAGVSLNQGPVALAEYGFAAAERGTYRKGSQTVEVVLYRMKDPSGAYGLLTYLRTPEMTRATLAKHSFMSAQEALVLCGNVVIDVHGQDVRRHEADWKVLARQVGAQAQPGALPTLWEELPAKGLIPGSDRYVLGPRTLDQFFPVAIGDSAGFDTGAEAEVARYRQGQRQVTMALLDLPTPQIATEVLRRLGGKFDVNGSKPGSSEPLYAKRLMTTVVMVSGAPTDAEAHTLLNEVRNREILTWNEPSPKGKQADIGTIVVGTIIGTGVICAFSVIAGLAFGGFRLAIKRAMPGKVFDRQKHMQVIQLGLSSKPISADDFYDRSGPRIKMGPVEKNLPDRVALRLFR